MNPLTQNLPPNYDEASVPDYVLPELLRMEDGRAVSDAGMWREERRPELLKLFRETVYGNPPPPLAFEARLMESGSAFAGAAVREQVRLCFGTQREASINLLIYRPAGTNEHEPAPVFLGLNFKGNASIAPDPAILPTESWTKEPHERGGQASRWPFETILARGYAVATFYYGDVAPDDPGQWRTAFPALAFPGGTGAPAEQEPGAVAWWSWLLLRALDSLLSRKEFDARRVTVIGHSRQGKAALWAGAQDERFAAAISNNSGCTGAALARRCFGETIAAIINQFPHWFCGNYREFAHREALLPVDQHQLVALLAPRPVYIASASEDLWADPRGEFLSAVAAAPVYGLMGCPQELGEDDFPSAGGALGDRIGYHLREGKHSITEWDWAHYLRFADRLLP